MPLTHPAFGVINGVSAGGGGGGASLPTHSVTMADTTDELLMDESTFGMSNLTGEQILVVFTHVKISNHGSGLTSLWGMLLDNGLTNLQHNLFLDDNGSAMRLRFIDPIWGFSPYWVTTYDLPRDANWHTVTLVWDTTQASYDDRVKMYIDGTLRSTGGGPGPSEAWEISGGFDTVNNGAVGWPRHDETTDQHNSDIQLYNSAIFIGSVPSQGDLHDNGSPKDLSNLTGVYSILNPVDSDPTGDLILEGSWSNTGVDTSTDIPS